MRDITQAEWDAVPVSEDDWSELKDALQAGTKTDADLCGEERNAVAFDDWYEYAKECIWEMRDAYVQHRASMEYEHSVYGPPNSPEDYGE